MFQWESNWNENKQRKTAYMNRYFRSQFQFEQENDSFPMPCMNAMYSYMILVYDDMHAMCKISRLIQSFNNMWYSCMSTFIKGKKRRFLTSSSFFTCTRHCHLPHYWNNRPLFKFRKKTPEKWFFHFPYNISLPSSRCSHIWAHFNTQKFLLLYQRWQCFAKPTKYCLVFKLCFGLNENQL